MKLVKLAELKDRLSAYFSMRFGKRPPASGDDAEWIDRLERRGVIRRARATLTAEWVSRAPAVDADVVAAVLKERDENP